jgi:hypothetical protein
MLCLFTDLKFAVNKQWILCTHLISASIVLKIVNPGLPYSKTTQVRAFSKKLVECKSAYQGPGPVNCKKKKAVPHFRRVEILEYNAFKLTVSFFVLDIQGFKSGFPERTFVRKEFYQLLR